MATHHPRGGVPLFPDPVTLDLPGAELRYHPALFEAARARALLQRLLAEIEWRQHHVRIHGRVLPCPRLSAWFGEPGARYTYSGLTLSAAGWAEPVSEVRECVEAALGERFDSVLLNLYRDGNDTMGWHSDDEPELGDTPLIASVSFGAARRFKLKHRRDKRFPAKDIVLESGSMLVMGGPTQRNWRHSLPRMRAVVEPRVNLTFRRVGTAGMLTA